MNIHYSATELFMNPQDFELKELYLLAWTEFPWAGQTEIHELVLSLASGDYEGACQAADRLTRYVTF